MAPHNDIARFHDVLRRSTRIMAICGAGLSASSGLPTFRGAGGLWRNHDAMKLATPEAFAHNPGFVWLFYAYRRHMSLKAAPNPGHYALAALAKKCPGFITVSQNVDNLLQRAEHPRDQLMTVHGSLFDVTCFNVHCDYIEHGNTNDPIWPILAPASVDADPNQTLPLLDPDVPAPDIKPTDIPLCPKCRGGLLRPGVVWFGENLPTDVHDDVDAFVDEGVDLAIVIGTSLVVSTGGHFVYEARRAGAVVCHVNLDAELPEELRNLGEGDFAFGGDAAELLPKLLEPLIGKTKDDGTYGL